MLVKKIKEYLKNELKNMIMVLDLNYCKNKDSNMVKVWVPINKVFWSQ